MTMNNIPDLLEMLVSKAFQFSDGSIVLTGRLIGGGQLRTPCRAALIVNDESLGFIDITSERMPGPALPRDHITVVARAPFPVAVERLESGRAKLRF